MAEARDFLLWLSGTGGAPLWFGLAILLLDQFDIALPRGDSFGVSGALVVAGIMVTWYWPFVAWVAAITVLAHVGRHGVAIAHARSGLFVRTCAITATFLVSVIVPMPSEGGVHPLLVVPPGVYLLVELAAAQALAARGDGRSFTRLLRGSLDRQAPLLAAQVSAAVLTAITYSRMGPWSLVLVVALLLLIRQSMAMLLNIRATYRATIAALVEAAEAQDLRRKGHSERTAQIARLIASRMGLSAAEVDKISYCALLHDIDSIAELESEDREDSTGRSACVLRGIEFFADLIPVLTVCDGNTPERDLSERDLVAAMTVALASDIDASRTYALMGAHPAAACSRVGQIVPASPKARVVSAAIELGYEIPAVY